MATTNFKEAIEFMEEFGFYDVILPFLLVFTIIFATLQKIKIFGKESTRYNALISLAISLMFVAATNLVESLNQYLPVLGLVLAIFLGLMLILGMFGVKEGTGTQKLGWVIAGGIAIAIGFSYLPEVLGGVGDFLNPLKEYSTIIIILVIIGGIIVWVTREGKTSQPSKPATPQ